MRTVIFFLTASFLLSDLYAQKPLILQGKFRNAGPSEMYFSVKPYDPITDFDTIKIEDDGSFYYKTYDCRSPQKIKLFGKKFILSNLLVAPGYNLTITADAKDERTLLTTIDITGAGACVNRYGKQLGDLYLTGKDSIGREDGIEMTASVRIPKLIKDHWLKDSVVNAVFPGCTDPYADVFRRTENYNNLFFFYYNVLDVADFQRFTDSAYFDFVHRYIPKKYVEHPAEGGDFNSESYRAFVDNFIGYKKRLQKAQKKNTDSTRNVTSEIISTSFTGKLRESFLFDRYYSILKQTTSAEELLTNRKQLLPYIHLYVGQPKQLFLQKVYDERYNFFNSLKAGNPAPAFTLPDSKGITHALSAFAGKVIYIDFWASWCGPCREETPAMKKLYSKFKDDDRLAIISIAVSDAKENWMQALANDKPEWLQLRDHKGELQKSYNTNSIPRFVLIDKKGKIVSMDAPRPSNTESLMKLIVSEIEK